MMPTIEAHSLPKRVSQGGKKDKRSMSSVYGASSDLHSVTGARERGSYGALLGKPSGSPNQSRSQSPGGRKMNLMSDPHKYVTDSGKVVDMNSAYRRLSDGAMLRSGGALASLPIRKGSDPAKGMTVGPDGEVRLAKDDFGDDSERAIQSSDEEDESSGSSDDENLGPQSSRGRRRTRQEDGSEKHGAEVITAKSLLASIEAERKNVASDYKVRSLLEPAVTVTGPDGHPERMSQRKKGGAIHPHTNYDASGSGLSTPFSSDTEQDMSEIKVAQQLVTNISPIHSIPEAHRCVRQILRGNYDKFQQEAEKGLRRQRVYLVATDLSEEAAYALEWTIGTVLRDGDTLLAVYAIDEENMPSDPTGATSGTTTQEEAGHLMRTLSNHQQMARPPKRDLAKLANTILASDSDPDQMGKAERERFNACVEVSDRCVKLLRKTRLQVRVVVEVFHCKSPKHMITEVIDFLEPTLVILGSRGRSALKGVLLGSFSNYLVTKSSVPVMVARKRLRKHSKYKRKNLRLSNVLANPTPKKLAEAKID